MAWHIVKNATLLPSSWHAVKERVAIAEFGDTYGNYMAEVPAFLPHLDRFFGGKAENERREAKHN
jgi:hypothetical protein